MGGANCHWCNEITLQRTYLAYDAMNTKLRTLSPTLPLVGVHSHGFFRRLMFMNLGTHVHGFLMPGIFHCRSTWNRNSQQSFPVTNTGAYAIVVWFWDIESSFHGIWAPYENIVHKRKTSPSPLQACNKRNNIKDKSPRLRNSKGKSKEFNLRGS